MSQDDIIESPEAAARRAALARQRFFMIGLFRLSGALIVLFGMLIGREWFGWVQGDRARWMGVIVALVGLFQFIIVPRLLARAFATPRQTPRKTGPEGE